MKIISPSHRAFRRPPKNLVPADEHVFKHEFVKQINATTLIELSNCFLLNDVIIKGLNFKKYMPFYRVNGMTNFEFFKRFKLALKGWRTMDKGVWITDNWSVYYFHWITDALPRLMASNKKEEKLPVLLPTYFKPFNFVSESLELLEREVVFVEPKVTFVKKLLLPSHTAGTGNYNEELINLLRKKMNPCNTEATKKIYVSRQKATKRKIINEREVQISLEALGFETHCFEDYTFKEQVTLLSATKYLVGLHGAGLTNMLFMPPAGKILELRNRFDAHNNCYFSLASALDHEYYYLCNDSDSDKTDFANVTVDIDRLNEVALFMQKEY